MTVVAASKAPRQFLQAPMFITRSGVYQLGEKDITEFSLETSANHTYPRVNEPETRLIFSIS